VRLRKALRVIICPGPVNLSKLLRYGTGKSFVKKDGLCVNIDVAGRLTA
jgi:hypothetical protein